MSSLVYALVGKAGHGKSSTANSLSASEHFLADDSLESVTSSVSSFEYTTVTGQTLVCLDLPGAVDPKELAAKTPSGLDALACVIRKGRLTDEALASISQLEVLFGQHFWAHAVIVFTHCTCDLDRLKSDLTKLGEDHVLNKVIKRSNNRVAKIDNMTRNAEQLTADVDYIHQLLAQVSTDTRKKYEIVAFTRAREATLEAQIETAFRQNDADLQALKNRCLQGLVSHEDFEKKAQELKECHELLRQLRRDIELEQAQRSFEGWERVKQFACYTGIATVGIGVAAAAAPKLAPTALCCVAGYAFVKHAEASTAKARADHCRHDALRFREERLRVERSQQCKESGSDSSWTLLDA
ncbi:Gimap9 [Symbiodinium necroappetens]|uniref:Gimap9 protein n=1 Tax=Symbiodinium necroappetens TaxID=1628268 RepID=A0A812W6P4_9DINO|nr:Gimap9 [Symbiodinium necroappetens]